MSVLTVLRHSPHGEAEAIATVGLVAAVVAVDHLGTSPRHAAAVAFGLLVAAMLVLAAVLVPWRRPPAPHADRAAALADLPAEQVARGRRLHAELRPCAHGATAVTVALVAGLGLTPAGAALITWTSGLAGGSWVAQVLAAAVAIALLNQALTAPFAAGKHTILRRYGLSTQTWRAWAVDRVKALAVGSALLSTVLLVFYGAGRASPHWWWAWAAVCLTAVSVLLTFVFPVLIAPIFNKFTPLEPGPLRDRLLALAAADRVPVRQVYVADASRRTRAVNAAVAGLGATRRVILFDNLLTPAQPTHDSPATDGRAAAMSDTLLRGATDDEIAVIVAHELAHAKYHDVARRTVLGSVRLAAIMCGLYLLDGWTALPQLAGIDSLTDPRGVWLLLAIVAAISGLHGPLGKLIARRVEARADRHALELTGDPASFEAAFRRAAAVNLADVSPSRLRYLLSASHPSIVERIATARAFARRQAQSTTHAACDPDRAATPLASATSGQVPR